jgi:hypothetical protein
MNQWQPIETAPRDKHVLGYDPHLKRPFIMVYHMGEEKFIDINSVFGDETPTHWMPLPEVPKD